MCPTGRTLDALDVRLLATLGQCEGVRQAAPHMAVELSARLRLHEAEGASTLAVEMLNGASGGVGTVGAALPASASYIDKVRTSVRTLFETVS